LFLEGMEVHPKRALAKRAHLENPHGKDSSFMRMTRRA
jgi:hypothetical protein